MKLVEKTFSPEVKIVSVSSENYHAHNRQQTRVSPTML